MLTHAHFDHLGFAERARRELGGAVYVHENDVIAGDAIVTLDPYTARREPCIVAGAATADSEPQHALARRARRDAAGKVLVGHGEPWRDGVEDAVVRARAAGAA